MKSWIESLVDEAHQFNHVDSIDAIGGGRGWDSEAAHLLWRNCNSKMSRADILGRAINLIIQGKIVHDGTQARAWFEPGVRVDATPADEPHQ